ncbi:MAG: hypothetical protein QF384_12245 [Alphaproteobacteria bacterium]|nr:hypothetical protein [Alphaproteobacteria bacterium]
MSTIKAAIYDRSTDRRWTKVTLAFLLLVGATMLAAQESHSGAALRMSPEIGQQY